MGVITNLQQTRQPIKMHDNQIGASAFGETTEERQVRQSKSQKTHSNISASTSNQVNKTLPAAQHDQYSNNVDAINSP